MVEASPGAEPIIVLRDVHKGFGGTKVLDGVSMVVPRGSTTAIVGPSGAGKSVLLKHVVGLLRPDSGEVIVMGVDMATAGSREMAGVRRRMGMLFQDGALFDSLSVGENISFPLDRHAAHLSEGERRDRVSEKLEWVGLPDFEDRSTSSLSGGQRKRVGLARAIVMEPEMVLFDEPDSGLDPMTSDAIDELILSMKERLGITFVIISHDMVGTMKVADQVAMLYDGRLVEYAPTDRFMRSDRQVVQKFLRRNIGFMATGPGRP